MNSLSIVLLLAGSLAGLLVGILIGALWQRLKAQQDRTQIEKQLTQLESTENLLQAQQSALVSERQELSEKLSLSQQSKAALEKELEVLQRQLADLEAKWTQQFEAFLLKQADVLKQQLQEKAAVEYKDKQERFDQRINDFLKPLYEKITEYKTEISTIHNKHLEDYGSLKTVTEQLRNTNDNLVKTLSHNKGRGNWGEIELLKLLEDSGLLENRDYFVQKSVGEGNLKRPDIRVALPHGRSLFVDAKALQVDVSDAAMASEDEEISRQERSKKLARSLEAAIKNLASKEYQQELKEAAGIVVLFVPRESMIAQALDANPALFEIAYRQNIILSGPFNLIGLFKLIHQGMQLAKLSEDAQDILKLSEDLYGQAVVFADRFEKLGGHLSKVYKEYAGVHKALESDRTGLLKRIRILEDYGAKGKSAKQLPEELELSDELKAAALDYETENNLLPQNVSVLN